MVDWHLNPDEFWGMTLAQIDAMLIEHRESVAQMRRR